jgi:hypothetical protein
MARDSVLSLFRCSEPPKRPRMGSFFYKETLMAKGKSTTNESTVRTGYFDSSNQYYPPYLPTASERDAWTTLLNQLTQSRIIVWRNYNQFNNRTLFDAIDDSTKRWNGYIPPVDLVSGNPTSNIFLNFTRNVEISYLSKVGMQLPEPKILAVNKKTNIQNKQLADVLKDLNKYSLQQENGPARLLEIALETTVKGTGIVYEGYMKNEQKMKTPVDYDQTTGKIIYRTEMRTIYDDCYQKTIPLEDFYISNPYEPDVQKQPYIIWKRITTYDEAYFEFSHYENWKYVRPGAYALTQEPTTFYRNKLYTELNQIQVEILRYYNRKDNQHIVTINGIVMYDGPIPFKDGKYPFAKYICEPYDNFFFWGMSMGQKFMGEQDVQNTLVNMMLDKTYGSLLPYGLSSDLDDLIEDDTLAPNKIRKVGDINKWKFDTLPGVESGEQAMFQTIMNLARENSGIQGGGDAYTPRGGKLPVRQVLLQQQEAMSKIGFSMNFLEDGERDRTELRINHILQFYTIPRIEKVTGKRGKEIEQLIYRDIKLNDVSLSDGRKGNKVIKLVDSVQGPDERETLADDLSVLEETGELQGSPTEALAVPVSMFNDYNYQVQIVKNSSYEHNQALDQAMRQEFAQWRIPLAMAPAPGVPPAAPADVAKIVSWVEEAYDVPVDEFELKQNQQPQVMQPGQGGQPGAQPATQELAPSGMANLEAMTG